MKRSEELRIIMLEHNWFAPTKNPWINGRRKYRGEARGALWGLSPPKFVKVSPSITED